MAMSFINLVSSTSLSPGGRELLRFYYVLILLTGLCWLDWKGLLLPEGRPGPS